MESKPKKITKKLSKDTLIECIENLKTELADKTKILDDIANESYQNGEHLKIAPFIPQYLGFEETVIEDKDDVTQARIYTKNGFNISQHINTQRQGWVILNPEKVAVNMVIENMYTAMTVLRACGMPISMKDYFEYNQKMEDNMLNNFSSSLEELKTNREVIDSEKDNDDVIDAVVESEE